MICSLMGCPTPSATHGHLGTRCLRSGDAPPRSVNTRGDWLFGYRCGTQDEYSLPRTPARGTERRWSRPEIPEERNCLTHEDVGGVPPCRSCLRRGIFSSRALAVEVVGVQMLEIGHPATLIPSDGTVGSIFLSGEAPCLVPSEDTTPRRFFCSHGADSTYHVTGISIISGHRQKGYHFILLWGVYTGIRAPSLSNRGYRDMQAPMGATPEDKTKHEKERSFRWDSLVKHNVRLLVLQPVARM